MVTSCHLLRPVLLRLYCTVWSVEIGTVTSIWQHLVTCWDQYHHVHIAISRHHLFRLIPSPQYKLNAQQSPTIYLQLYYKALLTYGVRIKCLVWSGADWNLSENHIRKHSMAVICTRHLSFSEEHCVSGVTNIVCQKFNFDISNSLKWYTDAKLCHIITFLPINKKNAFAHKNSVHVYVYSYLGKSLGC